MDGTYDELLHAKLKHFAVDANASGMLDWRQRIFDHVLHVKADIYLVEDDPQIVRFRIGDHDELERCWRLVVVEFIMARSVGDEASTVCIRTSPISRMDAGCLLVIGAAQLPDHVT